MIVYDRIPSRKPKASRSAFCPGRGSSQAFTRVRVLVSPGEVIFVDGPWVCAPPLDEDLGVCLLV